VVFVIISDSVHHKQRINPLLLPKIEELTDFSDIVLSAELILAVPALVFGVAFLSGAGRSPPHPAVHSSKGAVPAHSPWD
jgi:hypothetical protein